MPDASLLQPEATMASRPLPGGGPALAPPARQSRSPGRGRTPAPLPPVPAGARAAAAAAAAAADEADSGRKPPGEPCCPMTPKPLSGVMGSWHICLLIAYIIICLVAAFDDGWYEVSYSANPNIEPCAMPLSDCTLNACKPKEVRTGSALANIADCQGFTLAKACFLLAALYGLLCILFLAGLSCGHTGELDATNKQLAGQIYITRLFLCARSRPMLAPRSRFLPGPSSSCSARRSQRNCRSG
eukprot:SAG22_NODE_5786_length_952_cov_2.256741_2_plen_243_part_00